jgi:hypothetical protein
MDELKRQAQAAYERGRRRLGLRQALLVLPVGALAIWRGSALEQGPIALGVFLMVAAFAWRGGALGRAVWPGLLGGTVAFGLPLLATAGGLAPVGCGATAGCLSACIAGGVGAGIAIGRLAGPRSSLLAALAIAGGLAALSCLPLGASALIAAGAAAGVSAPVTRWLIPART